MAAGCGGDFGIAELQLFVIFLLMPGARPRARGTCTQDGGCAEKASALSVGWPSDLLLRANWRTWCAADLVSSYRTIVPLSRQLFPCGRGGTLKFSESDCKGKRAILIADF